MILRTILILAIGALFVLLCGCSGTQAVAKAFVRTQPEVSIKRKEYEDPVRIVGGTAAIYIPAASDGTDALLQTFAPIIVQGIEPSDKNSYPADSDLIGQPELTSVSAGNYTVSVDTQHPTIFSSIEKVRVSNTTLTQLVYVFWYPRHPIGLVEKGDIDGGVLRITLDAAQRPAVYEYVMACGCWHGVFVGESIEAWAEKEFKSSLGGKKWFVEKPVENQDDWKVRDIVWQSKTQARPVVFVSAGRHECLAIQNEGTVHLNQSSGRQYTLQNYSALEHLSVRGGSNSQEASMFNPEGLVWGGRRKGEEKMFTKLDHGGWPRRLDAMKIHWDQEGWNDSSLLEKFMRLPREMTDPAASVVTLHK